MAQDRLGHAHALVAAGRRCLTDHDFVADVAVDQIPVMTLTAAARRG